MVIDADQLAREVVEPETDGFGRVVAAFGPRWWEPDGRLDRPRLAEIVFNDPVRLATLNAIVHPRVAARTAELAASAPENSVLVVDVPLLVENHLEGAYDVVLVVDAPDDVRIARLTGPRGLTESDVRARMAAQATREDRLEAADFVVDNSGDLARPGGTGRRGLGATRQPQHLDREVETVGGPSYRGGMRPVSELVRTVAPFEVIADFQPSGDQPTAIDELEQRIRAGEKDVVLLGATGTGKSATTAWLIERLQRPTLVLAPNKTLAAQLANEFRELLPNNAVEYFVSYYDYYQPEAYVPQTDTYIEKDSSINDEVERLRHSATNSLLTRRDVVVVASVSCIYGLGTPQEYLDRSVSLRVGDTIERDALLRRFVDIQYTRNDLAFTRGTFRVRGDTVEIFPVYEEHAVRIEMFGDEVERLMTLHPLTGEVLTEDVELRVFPATHYVAGPERMERAIVGIEAELEERLAEMERQGKLLEAQRLRMRTTYDLEMMRQVGSCSGIENYTRHIDGRGAGHRAAHAARLLPRGLPARHRRVARDRAADRRRCTRAT